MVMKRQALGPLLVGIVGMLLPGADAGSGSMRVCNTEDDLQVEFSECDPLGVSRNGK